MADRILEFDNPVMRVGPDGRGGAPLTPSEFKTEVYGGVKGATPSLVDTAPGSSNSVRWDALAPDTYAWFTIVVDVLDSRIQSVRSEVREFTIADRSAPMPSTNLRDSAI